MTETLIALLVFAILAALAVPAIAQLAATSRGLDRAGGLQRDRLVIDRFLAAVAREALADDIAVGESGNATVTHRITIARLQNGPRDDGERLEWWVEGDLRRTVDLDGEGYEIGLLHDAEEPVLQVTGPDGNPQAAVVQRIYLTAPRDCRYNPAGRSCLPPEVQ